MTLNISDAVGTVFVDSNGNGHAEQGADLIEWVYALTNTGTPRSTPSCDDLLGESRPPRTARTETACSTPARRGFSRTTTFLTTATSAPVMCRHRDRHAHDR